MTCIMFGTLKILTGVQLVNAFEKINSKISAHTTLYLEFMVLMLTPTQTEY